MGTLAFTRNAREMRAYCDGVAAAGALVAKSTNFYGPAGTDPEPTLAAAWDAGWEDHNGGAGDGLTPTPNVDLSMCGVPVAGKPSPEVLDPTRA